MTRSADAARQGQEGQQGGPPEGPRHGESGGQTSGQESGQAGGQRDNQQADPQERQRVARAAAGDAAAFAALVRAHQGYLRKLLARVCRGDQARADDLAQEAFVRAWRALPGFRGEARFRTWLTRLAYSSLAAERPQLPAHDVAIEALGEPSACSDFAPGVDWRIDLDRALADLSEPQRHALLLTYGADLSHAEAAQVLGWPLGTLKTQVLRAKMRLRAQLQDWEPRA